MNFQTTFITRALIAACGALALSVGAQAAGDKSAYEQAEKSAKARKESSKSSKGKSDKKEPTKAELMKKARAQDVAGRSKMSKAELERSVHA